MTFTHNNTCQQYMWGGVFFTIMRSITRVMSSKNAYAGHEGNSERYRQYVNNCCRGLVRGKLFRCPVDLHINSNSVSAPRCGPKLTSCSAACN